VQAVQSIVRSRLRKINVEDDWSLIMRRQKRRARSNLPRQC